MGRSRTSGIISDEDGNKIVNKVYQGRRIFRRLGAVSQKEAEQWLARYEAGGVFFARLLPVVRHLISIPAGIVRMNFGVFSLVTIAGSALWCWILAYLGDKAYRLEPQLLTSPEALEHFIRQQSKGILLLIAVFAGLYMLALRLMKPRGGA